MPPAAGPEGLQSVARHQDGDRHLGGRLVHGRTVSGEHSHLLLRPTSGDRYAAGRLARVQHSARVDAPHEVRHPGLDRSAVRSADVRHDSAVRLHRADAATIDDDGGGISPINARPERRRDRWRKRPNDDDRRLQRRRSHGAASDAADPADDTGCLVAALRGPTQTTQKTRVVQRSDFREFEASRAAYIG